MKMSLQIHHYYVCENRNITQYLELSLFIWPERLPLWRVEELVAVDVMQELAFQRHIDPVGDRGRYKVKNKGLGLEVIMKAERSRRSL